jgi:uncharacterized protein YjdB
VVRGKTHGTTTLYTQLSEMRTRYVRPASGFAGLGMLILALACGGGGDNSPTGGSGLSKIVLTPDSATIQIGDTITITAQPQSGNGSPVSGVTLFWSSSNEGVATVNNGKVIAISPGTASIAASANGVSAAATVVVTIKNVASIAIAPATASLFINGTVQLAATLKDSSGNILTGRTVTWSSSNAAAASVDQSGFVLAHAVGSATISATSGGATGTAAITVSNVPVASITISPTAPTVIVGQTTQLTGTAKDAAGNVLSGRTFAWVSSDTTIAKVGAATGVVTGIAAGTARVTASSGTVTSAPVTVTVQNPPPASVVISPSVGNLLVGQTLQLTATVTDGSGNPIVGAQVTYTSGNTGVATVTTAGLVTGVAPGTAVITGKSGTAVGAAAINVAVVPVARITIAPALDTVISGGQVQLTATAYDSAGTVLTGRTLTWTSGNTADATVSATGLVTASSSTSITTARTLTVFAASGSVQGAATIVVRPVGIQSVTVAPALDTVVQGATRQLAATVVDSLGRTVTRTISWSSADPTIASVSGSGLVTGGANTGTTQITATTAGASGTNTTVVIQTQATSVSVALSPSNDTLVIGASGGKATATTTPAGRSVTWSSSNTAVATIDASGNIAGVGLGSATITGTSGSASGSAVLAVVLDSIHVTPNPLSVPVGSTQAATATGYDANGSAVSGVTFTWSTTNTAIATVDGAGTVTGRTVGSTTLLAAGGGRTSSPDAVTVTQAPAASVTLSPTPDTIFATAPNNAVTLTATVKDASNNVLTGVPLTWASTSNVTGVVGGVVTASGAGVGSTTITATTANTVVGSASVVVIGHVGTVVLSPAAGTTTLSSTGIGFATSTTVTATVLDTFGNQVTPLETLTWTSSDPTNVPITVNGLPVSGAIPASTGVTVTAVGAVIETVTITATATDGSVVGTTTISIIL